MDSKDHGPKDVASWLHSAGRVMVVVGKGGG